MADRPDGWSPSARDRATRLADVIIAWNVFQHFYPYFDVVDTDWEAMLEQSLTSAATDPDERAFLATLRRLVAGLYDCHGAVYHPIDSVRFLPPVLWDWIEDSLAVTDVAANIEADLRPGDVIVEIDGIPAKEAIEALELQIPGATPQWRRWRAVRKLGNGERGTTLDLKIRTPEGAVRTVTLARTTDDESLREHRPEPVTELQPGVYYVDLGRLEEKEFTAVLPRLARAQGVVLDLRGHLRISPWTVASHLIDEPAPAVLIATPVVMRPDGEAMTFNYDHGAMAYPQEPRFRGGVVVLTDGRAMSADETFLGMVEHYRLADIVGGPSAGTNGTINTFSLPGGYQVRWTGARVLKLDGSQHHGIGILPTVPVSRTIAGVAEGRDEVLERAIALIDQ
jgi:C-terminal processing protease CtpA/Prc